MRQGRDQTAGKPGATAAIGLAVAGLSPAIGLAMAGLSLGLTLAPAAAASPPRPVRAAAWRLSEPTPPPAETTMPASAEAPAEASGFALPAAWAQPIAQPPLLGPEAATLAADELTALDHAYDAFLAEAVLKSVGQLAMLPRLHATAATPTDPFHAHQPAEEAGFDWKGLTKAQLGAEQRLAVGFNQSIDTANYNTALSLHHAAGPIDVTMNVKGDQPLAARAPMSLAYDSTALVAVAPALRVGVAASGGLGTLQALTPASGQVAGPVMQLRLLGGRTSISTDAGYDFAIDPAAGTLPPRFHMNVGLHVSL